MEKWSRYNYEQKKAKDKIRYDLDSGDIRSITYEETKVILRAADELIATGGRSYGCLLGCQWDG